MKVALVHDFLNQVGGAEKVLEIFHEIFPRAPVYTITYDEKETRGAFKHLNIKTSFIQRLPFGVKQYKWYISMMPAAIEQFDFSKYDIVLSDCSAFSKGVIVRPETLHISYVHSPTRYIWKDTHSYTEEIKQPGVIKKMLPLVLQKIRTWDQLAALRVDKMIANSKTVSERIEKYYKRKSDIIYPPVETGKYYISNDIDDYFLVVSRLRPYKRVDLVVEAFNALRLPLKVIGTGEKLETLKKMANDNIEFLGPVSDKEKAYYLSRCKAFIHPQEEDFGITALEAMASGRPVIAYKKGGAVETVIPKKTGILFEDQSPWSLVDVVRDFNDKDFNPEEIRKRALDFDIKLFKNRIEKYIFDSYRNFKDSRENYYKIN